MAFSAEYVYRILDQYSGPLARITRTTAKFQDMSLKASGSMRRMGQRAKEAGAEMSAKLTLPIVGMGLAAAKTAVDFQSAFIGVQKTVTATPKQFAQMNEELKKMSTIIPVSATELMGIAESAGQLGIERKNITSFTKTIAMLGATTNLSGQEGATQLARFANITGMSEQNFDRLGSTIVALGNNLATSEAEIVNMSMGLAMAGKTVGLTEAQIMGFAGALSSIGIEAEAGSTAFSRALYAINSAIGKNSPELAGFAKIAGKSTKDFAALFKKDASKGMMSFIKGLGKMPKDKINLMLDALGFKEVRLVKAITGAALASDKFSDALTIGNQAWIDNNALINEALLRFKSWASQFKIAWNKLKSVANEFGKILVPMFIDFIDLTMPLLRWFSQLSPSIKKTIVVVGGLVAAIGPLLMMLGVALPAISAIAAAIGSITLPVAAVIAGFIALGALWGAMLFKSAALRQAFVNLFDAFKPLLDVIGQATMLIGKGLATAFGESTDSVKTLGDAIANVVNAVAAVLSVLVKFATWVPRLVIGSIEPAINFIKNLDEWIGKIGERIEATIRKFRELGPGKVFEGFKDRLGLGADKIKGAFSTIKDKLKLEVFGKAETMPVTQTTNLSGLGDKLSTMQAGQAIDWTKLNNKMAQAPTPQANYWPTVKNQIGQGAAANKAGARQDNKMEVSGQIGVTATGNAKVEKADINLNQGYNLAVAQ